MITSYNDCDSSDLLITEYDNWNECPRDRIVKLQRHCYDVVFLLHYLDTSFNTFSGFKIVQTNVQMSIDDLRDIALTVYCYIRNHPHRVSELQTTRPVKRLLYYALINVDELTSDSHPLSIYYTIVDILQNPNTNNISRFMNFFDMHYFHTFYDNTFSKKGYWGKNSLIPNFQFNQRGCTSQRSFLKHAQRIVNTNLEREGLVDRYLEYVPQQFIELGDPIQTLTHLSLNSHYPEYETLLPCFQREYVFEDIRITSYDARKRNITSIPDIPEHECTRRIPRAFVYQIVDLNHEDFKNQNI